MGADEIGSVSAARRERRDVRIRGPWFSVARVVLIAMALLMLELTAAGFVAGLRHWELTQMFHLTCLVGLDGLIRRAGSR
jgi:hypothetical protein